METLAPSHPPSGSAPSYRPQKSSLRAVSGPTAAWAASSVRRNQASGSVPERLVSVSEGLIQARMRRLRVGTVRELLVRWEHDDRRERGEPRCAATAGTRYGSI